jgi:hypothetical protein
MSIVTFWRIAEVQATTARIEQKENNTIAAQEGRGETPRLAVSKFEREGL